MKSFLDEDFLLHSETARALYHDYAARLPVVDFHTHLPPQEIAENRRFSSMTEIWLQGDHYKWRALRALGVDERYITGDATDWEKFEQWAKAVPWVVRNPLYHWTHLELQKPFVEKRLLSPQTARSIYDGCNALLQEKYSTQGLLEYYNVETVCTTDDPCDDLAYHIARRKTPGGARMLPTFRPDRALEIDRPNEFIAYVERLESVENVRIQHYEDFLSALLKRHDFFHTQGCRVADHGLQQFYQEEFSPTELRAVFAKARNRAPLTPEETRQFKMDALHQIARWNQAKGWVQQYHLGALRNNNTRQLNRLGRDSGYDSIGDFPQVAGLAHFLDRLEKEGALAKTIVYPINPSDFEAFATMMGNFHETGVPGKMQLGAAWWFLDQKDGIQKQLDALSNMGLLSQFVGMVADSRSFLSFSRHEYFRRVLCNVFGADVERGELPNDLPHLGNIVENICYHNPRRYFGF